MEINKECRIKFYSFTFFFFFLETRNWTYTTFNRVIKNFQIFLKTNSLKIKVNEKNFLYIFVFFFSYIELPSYR